MVDKKTIGLAPIYLKNITKMPMMLMMRMMMIMTMMKIMMMIKKVMMIMRRIMKTHG